jgi:peptidylprolyl isomerase/peptidyl-prolyl cis-trans isomerase A (cyclophilin A)
MPRMTRTLGTLILAALLARGSAAAEEALAEAKPEAKPAARKGVETYAVFATSRGKIAARLLATEAPQAVRNFVELATGKKEWTDPKSHAQVRRKLYDGTLLHRVIPSFMVQGGDPASQGAAMLTGPPQKEDRRFGTHGPGYSFDDELKAGDRPFDKPCQLAMANSGPNTNGSQFFITEVPVAHLNPKACGSKSGVCGYVHFGVVVCGCERVAQIARAGSSQTRLEKVLIVHGKPSCD